MVKKNTSLMLVYGVDYYIQLILNIYRFAS